MDESTTKETKQIYYAIYGYISKMPGITLSDNIDENMESLLTSTIQFFMNNTINDSNLLFPFFGFISFTCELMIRYENSNILTIFNYIIPSEIDNKDEVLIKLLERICENYNEISENRQNFLNTDLTRCLSKMLTIINIIYSQNLEFLFDAVEVMKQFIINENDLVLLVRLSTITYRSSKEFNIELIEHAINLLDNDSNINTTSILSDPLFDALSDFVLEFRESPNLIQKFIQFLPQNGEIINKFFNDLVYINRHPGIISTFIEHSFGFLLTYLVSTLDFDKIVLFFETCQIIKENQDCQEIVSMINIEPLLPAIGELFENMKENNENESMIFLLSVLLIYDQRFFEHFKEVIVYVLNEIDFNLDPNLITEICDLMFILLFDYYDNIKNNDSNIYEQCINITFNDCFVTNLIEHSFFYNPSLFNSYTRLINSLVLYKRIPDEEQEQANIVINRIIGEYYINNFSNEYLKDRICESVVIFCCKNIIDSADQDFIESCFHYILDNYTDFDSFIFYIALSRVLNSESTD